MEYNLIKISELASASVLKDVDYIVADVKVDSPSGTGVFQSKRVEVKNAFATDNFRLSNASSLQIDLKDPIFANPNFKDIVELLEGDLITQSDANLLFSTTLKVMMEELRKVPKVILKEGPEPPDLNIDVFGDEVPYNEGTIWIDTNTFRQYVYFRDRNLPNNSGDYTDRWIALTDR